MSFDKYVHHIAQKYRLAVAISVIKTKPDNLSIEDYLLQLQTKIKDSEIDLNETVCSDDFNFDDATAFEKSQTNTLTDRTKCDITNETLLDFGNENDSQGSQTILNDFVFGDEREPNNVPRKGDLEDTIMLLKQVTADSQEQPDTNQNLSQLTFCESQKDINNTNNDITYCSSNIISPNNVTEINKMHIQNCNENNNMDSQETELYTLQGFTQNYTHVSQTQGEYFVMPDKYIRNKENGNMQDHLEDYQQNRDNTPMICKANQNVLTENEFAIANNEIAENSKYAVVQNVDNAFGNIQLFHSQDIRITKEFTDKDTFTVVKGDENIRKVTQNGVTYVDNSNLAQTFQFNIHSSTGELTNNSKAIVTKDKDMCKDRIILTETNVKDAQNTHFGNENPSLSIDSQNTPKESTDANIRMDTNDIRNKDNSVQYSKYILETDKLINNNQNTSVVNDQQPTLNNIENEFEMDVDETDSDENLPERMPFKVLEEFNRVKSFLNKKDRRNTDGGYSTDSGYRSDSKSRSLKSCSQLSGMTGNWLNQSAYCLFNHIIVTTGTDDIVKEIAQVLGELIDKLHEEENYPPFLEELLESVDSMVRETLEGGGWAENVIITKDDNVQRLILLNKSKHILQYTIEKITKMLEDLHTNLTQENLYELTNILAVENVCYIFHLLEIFLKRYMKVKDISSQSTQNSQEDSFPKRSSLTELWRKKWNPNCKEVIKNENKTCILKRCSDILNKIIVECMDGYSLVAFAALQCFNLIQV